MHPSIKILIGAFLVVLGVYSTATFLEDLIMILKGGIGPLLVLIGAFIVWLESDEWKMMREGDNDSMEVQQQFKPETGEPEAQSPVESKTEKYSCPQCGKEFDTERGMKIHQAQKHD